MSKTLPARWWYQDESGAEYQFKITEALHIAGRAFSLWNAVRGNLELPSDFGPAADEFQDAAEIELHHDIVVWMLTQAAEEMVERDRLGKPNPDRMIRYLPNGEQQDSRVA